VGVCGKLPREENTTMIASDVQQRIDAVSEQLTNLRGYL
jgi:hypothetical protein